MKPEVKSAIFPWLIVISLVLIAIIIWTIEESKVPEVNREDLGLVIIQGNSIRAIAPPYYFTGTRVSGCLVETHYSDDLIIADIVEKLIACESGGNPKAHNEDDPNDGSFGILQFQRGTWEEFCVKKYGFPDDIWNTTTQISCAVKMIEQGYGSRWSCWEGYPEKQ